MKRCLTIDEEIKIFQFVQGLYPIGQMQEWFKQYSLSDKQDIIHNLLNLVIQSHPSYEEIEMSAMELRKNKSPSAVKLLNKNKPYEKYGYELCFLPERELEVTLSILLLVLRKADCRRKVQERESECSHWWHKDLSNQDYLRELRNR